MTSTNEKQVWNHLSSFMDNDDVLIVVEANSWAVNKVKASPYQLDVEVERK
ncbi:MAG: hypothetical protein KAU01_06735 [Candidatus Cloacimonetes bacterium]|nr:hypothetical protein [Candidatus Cloacimonadota bacterium]